MSRKDETVPFNNESLRREHIKEIIRDVAGALKERGYKPENQITGYLISNDPAYISSYQDARHRIQQVDRYEILVELLRSYLADIEASK